MTSTRRALSARSSFVGEVNTLAGEGAVSASDADALKSARDVLVELMDVLGVAIADEGRDAAYPAEVIDLAAELTGYAGSDAREAVDALLDARAAARKESNGRSPTACATGFRVSASSSRTRRQGARVTFEG